MPLCLNQNLLCHRAWLVNQLERETNNSTLFEPVNFVFLLFLQLKILFMKKVKITVIRKACYRDLMEKYENPIEHACDLVEGKVFIANGWQRPEGLCESAWEVMSPFVMTLAHGGGNFYDGWMKNEMSAMISCNDGFRPVSFLIEALDEESN